MNRVGRFAVLLAAGLGAALGAVGAARAECRPARYQFQLQGEAVSVPMAGRRGDTCELRWSVTARVHSARVLSPPRNGQVITTANRATYVPRTGFAGADIFRVEICGEGGQGNGCSTLNVSINLN